MKLPNWNEAEETLKKEHPLGFGTEQDIAYAALFLTSDESRYMTGSPLIRGRWLHREMSKRTGMGLPQRQFHA